MTIQEKDQQYIWHPYTHQKGRMPAIPITKGKGTLLYDENGKTYIDAISSWWVNIHGHGNKYIAKKIYNQAKDLQQVIFTEFTHTPAVNLAEILVRILPGNFSKVFYSDNGSTATEVALKMAIQYWKNNGDTKRNKIIAFHNSYHGDTFGAMSISERGIYTVAFQDKLFEVKFIDTPNAENINLLKQELEEYKEEIACLIYEPLLQGAGGMLMYEAQHLNELLHYLKQEKIICIADEVLTGFYRTGKFFAGEYMEEKADIICLSKGLTGGTMALGVTACTENIYSAFVSDDKTKTLFHGHSFTANSLACTAGIASYELLIQKNYLNSIAEIINLHKKFAKSLKPLEEANAIKNIRQTGTIFAFEICTPENDDYLNKISTDYISYCLKRGVFLRSMGNTIYIMPPYCITKKELKKVYKVILSFIKNHLKQKD